MSLTDLGIVMLCAVLGWGIVSWIISVVQQQKAPPLDLSGGAPPPRLPGVDSPPRPDDPHGS